MRHKDETLFYLIEQIGGIRTGSLNLHTREKGSTYQPALDRLICIEPSNRTGTQNLLRLWKNRTWRGLRFPQRRTPPRKGPPPGAACFAPFTKRAGFDFSSSPVVRAGAPAIADFARVGIWSGRAWADVMRPAGVNTTVARLASQRRKEQCIWHGFIKFAVRITLY
jgi:hypothetical protein